jgi:hypothetical protein
VQGKTDEKRFINNQIKAIMTIKEFLQKFLPDYEIKYKLMESEVIEALNEEREKISNSLIFKKLNESCMKRYFPEALQNFTDRICEEQRKLCADVYNEEIGYKEPDNNIYNRILEYEQPEIEEI